MFLVAGLGNPGERYRNTRHNIGFMLVDCLWERYGETPWKRQRRSLVCRIKVGLKDVLLAKPQTFMNLSGQAIRELLAYNPVKADQILIAYDEISLPLGKIRIRRSGSAGGHRGMESVLGSLGSAEVPRIRLGVAGDTPREDLADYVLSNFSRAEKEPLQQVLERAEDAVVSILEEGFDQAMNFYNR